MSRRELLKGSTDTLLLSIVASKPKYGYQLVKEIEERSSGYFQFKEGTLYPALHRLEADGFITGSWEEAQNGQLRRYYHITPQGLKALGSLQREWKLFSRAVNLVVQT